MTIIIVCIQYLKWAVRCAVTILIVIIIINHVHVCKLSINTTDYLFDGKIFSV